MKSILFSVVLLSFTSSAAFADKECLWQTERDGQQFETVSEVRNPKNVQDCFEALKRAVILTEPRRTGREFDGVVIVREPGQEPFAPGVASCKTETIQGLTPAEDNRMFEFIADARKFNDPTGDSVAASPKWKTYLDSKMKLACGVGLTN